jgi:CDP-glycerol glycerophosphotransferase (TagB/SpsB family)
MEPTLGGAPVALFVAREPDETLRTFLPVLRALRERDRCTPFVLYHHRPGDWARAELSQLGVGWREVKLPDREAPDGVRGTLLARTKLLSTYSELRQLARVRSLANRLTQWLTPAVVVVIQDTLLLERFLVRAANTHGRPTLAIQWAFTYPQEYYDRFHEPSGTAVAQSRIRSLRASMTRRAYRAALGLLGVGFQLANTYGGGEAQFLAVMGEAFRQQFLAQGARKREIYVTGHPSHDSVFRHVQKWQESDRLSVISGLGFSPHARLIAYATQPTLWRGVLTADELRAMVEDVVDGVLSRGPDFALVVKLHPRERPEDYAFLSGRERVTVVKDADIQRIIAASDVFISSSSSTLLYAMMFGKPIVTINFHSVQHFDFFAGLGGTLHVTRPGDLSSAVDAALSDTTTRAWLRREQMDLLERYSRFDGCATDRLVSLIEGWAINGAAR